MKRNELIKVASGKCSAKHGAAWLGVSNALLVEYVEGRAGCPICNGEVKQAESKMEETGMKDGLADIIAEALKGKITAGLDKEGIEKIVDGKLGGMRESIKEIVEGLAPRKLEVITEHSKVVLDGLQHKAFETVLQLVAMRLNVYMVGAAGTGKTTIGEQVAEALKIPFYAMSVGLQTSKADFFGYVDAHGKLVRTTFREAYENGGVFLIDEIDSGNSNVLTSINAATANNLCGFADGMVKKHANFVCLAAANTYGNGQDRVYVGRNQIDGATLDRFAFVAIDTDEDMERKAALSENENAQSWVDKVQCWRKKAESLKVRHIISPRASINGARLLKQGKIKEKEIAELIVWKGIAADTRKQIEG